MEKVTRYRDWAPTQFDATGLGLEDQQDWIVAPVLTTRDAGPLTESNFETAQRMLDDSRIDYEVHRFGHWGPGFFEIILLEPTEEAQHWVEEVAQLLNDYPVLDDEDFSQRELAAAELGWEQASIAERIEALQAEGLSIFAARRDDMPIECLEHFRGDAL